MFGTVYFNDGHTEPIISYQFNISHTEFYFTTNLWQYGFKDHIKCNTCNLTFARNSFLVKTHTFYKYDKMWIATSDIDHIEIFTEVFVDD